MNSVCLFQEHIIHVWGETASLFHNVLALHYKDQISEKMEDYLRDWPSGLCHLYIHNELHLAYLRCLEFFLKNILMLIILFQASRACARAKSRVYWVNYERNCYTSYALPSTTFPSGFSRTSHTIASTRSERCCREDWVATNKPSPSTCTSSKTQPWLNRNNRNFSFQFKDTLMLIFDYAVL